MTEADAIELSSDGPDGRARAAALAAAAAIEARPTSLVSYRSAGALAIIGPAEQALAAAERVRARLRCTVVTPDDAAASSAAPADVTVLREKVIQVTGHLGQYAVIVAAPPPLGGANLLQKLGSEHTHFDLVLDLSEKPLIEDEVTPFGYYPTRGAADVLEKALTELPEMVGEFEKPRFFNYNPDICAHGANGLTGCTRCIDACPTASIISMGEEVAVDPYKCQGAGTCATACPTGAMTYVYPTVSDHLAKLNALLKTYRAERGTRAVILYYDAEAGRERLRRLAPRLPEHVIPLQVAEIGSVGMDVWLAALAYGAAAVFVLPTPATPKRVYAEIEAQMGYARAVLGGMGYREDQLSLLSVEDADALAALGAAPATPLAAAASFAVFDEKRTTLRLAIEHLYGHAPARRAQVALPAGAPFGQIFVNREACTLCLSCVGACPSGALADGGELPQLNFIEDNCVQCGLCMETCPEHAIRLEARYLYDPQARRKPRVMHQEAPFHCISCGKPFATHKMMARMTEKLQEHWMFQKDDALKRIQMCGDCRVRDMFQAESRRTGAH